MKRFLLVSLVLSLWVLSQGTSPLAYGAGCGCGGPGPVVASCDACEPCAPCASCCTPCCDPIRGVLMLPLKTIEWLTHLGCYDNGCGERYWGECSEPVDCWDPCDGCGNWTGHAGRPYGGAAVPAYARAPRPATYAQQPTQGHPSINAEFGLDSSAQVLSRSDRVVAPAQVQHSSAARPMTSQAAQPRRAPVRR